MTYEALSDRIFKLEKSRDEKLALLDQIIDELRALDQEFRDKAWTDDADYKRLNLSLDEATHRTALNATLMRLRHLRSQKTQKDTGKRLSIVA